MHPNSQSQPQDLVHRPTLSTFPRHDDEFKSPTFYLSQAQPSLF